MKGTEEPTETTLNSQSWNNLSYEINKIPLDYNPKYEVNIHESMLLKIND